MRPEDVGSVWRLARRDDAAPDRAAPLSDNPYVAILDDVGAVQLSGWIAEAAKTLMGQAGRLDLATLLADADLDPAEQERVRETVSSGGGVIGVKARDATLDDDLPGHS